MSYKIKSLVYFTCFLASTLAYYAIGDDNQMEQKESTEFAELSVEHITTDKTKVLK